MKKCFYLTVILTFVTMLPTCVFAQSILENLKFENPECLIIPKGNNCNVRQTTSTKSTKTGVMTSHYLASYKTAYAAHKVGDWYRVEGNYKNDCGEENWDHLAGWFKGKAGYISGSVVNIVTPTPFTKQMLCPNRYFTAEDMDAQWTWILTDDVGESKMALLWLHGNCENFLALGKRVAPGVFQFKYCLNYFEIEEDSSNESTFMLKKRNYTDGSNEVLVLGEKYYVASSYEKAIEQNIMVPNFQLFNNAILERLFKDTIKNGPNWNVYITPANFPSSDRNQWNL